MINRRETLKLFVSMPILSIFPINKIGFAPIIKVSVFQKYPIVYGYYLDQSEPLVKEYGYYQRRSKVYLNKKYAGSFRGRSYNKLRAWGEMTVTERHLFYPKTCSAACICRRAGNGELVVHLHAEWTSNTRFLPDVPFVWRDSPDFKDRECCSFCGSDEAIFFEHDRAEFYCSSCQNKKINRKEMSYDS